MELFSQVYERLHRQKVLSGLRIKRSSAASIEGNIVQNSQPASIVRECTRCNLLVIQWTIAETY